MNEFEQEEKAYLKYKEIIGGEPLGLTVPYGYPQGVEEMGGVIKVYEECIKQGKTWEELLDVKDIDSDYDI